MRTGSRFLVGVGVLALGGVTAALAQNASPAIFSPAQATQGAAAYDRSCAVCHGADLTGGGAPELKGPAFNLRNQAGHVTVGQLLQTIVKTMPKGNPGGLSAEENNTIVAYILQQNGFAAGATPLTADNPQLASTLVSPAQAPLTNDHGVAATPAATARPGVPETVQAAPVTAEVTVSDAMLRNAGKDADNWLLFGRTYDNQRFSPLSQVNDKNVRHLVPVSIIQTGIANSFEASPIVVNGVMYVSTPNDHVHAFNAVTGEILWTYTPRLGVSKACCGPVSRGVAVAYGKVFVAQLDGVVAALDARTGKLLWKTDPATTLPPPDPSFYSFTLAPQVYDGMVLVGSAGAEYPTRGFVQAYNADTGAVIWRFDNIPGPGEPGHETWVGDTWKYGGGSAWDTPAIDLKQGLILFGVGNPNPDNKGDLRPGPNPYTDSVVAISAKTGKLAWWNQIIAHDMWDYDQCSPVVFFDADDGSGKMVPAVGEAGKEGNLYIIDRRTGKLIRKSDPFVLQSSTMFTKPGTGNVPIYPSPAGGNTWSPAAYSPQTHDFYVPGANMAWSYTADTDTQAYTSGTPVNGQYNGGSMHIDSDLDKSVDTISSSGTFSAINVNTGKIAWQYKSDLPMVGGAMATAGNLVFTGEQNGWFDAFDAKTGKKLWRFYLGVGVAAPPVSYRVNGRQYIAVAAGGVSANGYQPLLVQKGRPVLGDVVAIFALPDR